MSVRSTGGAAALPNYKVCARRILAKAASAMPVVTAATPATLTQGASSAVSTINGANVNLGSQTYSYISPQLSDISGTWGIDVSNNYGYIGTHVFRSGSSRTGARGQGKRFFFDGQKFDICGYGMTTRICATDLATGVRAWYSGDTTGPTNYSYLLVDFGSRAYRIVEVYHDCGNTTAWHRGFNFLATDTVRPWSDPSETKAIYLGDSYTFGTNNDSIRTPYAHVSAEALGIRNAILNGVSGTGVMGLSGNAWGVRFAGDLAQSLIGTMDLVFAFAASINDSSASDAAVQAAVTAWVSAAMIAQPRAIFMLSGPQFTSGNPTTVSRYAAVQAGVLAAANGDPRVVYIDNGPTTSVLDKWQYGSGNVGAPNGTGNNDNYIESAGTHWTAEGNKYGGKAIAGSIINKLTALAA